MWIDAKFLAGVSLAKQDPVLVAPQSRTAIHLRCAAEEADRIRQAAKRRQLSISNFVVFSLHRHWKAVQHVRNA